MSRRLAGFLWHALPTLALVVGLGGGCAKKPKLRMAPYVAKPEAAPQGQRSCHEVVSLYEDRNSPDITDKWHELVAQAPAVSGELYFDEAPLPGTPWYEYLRCGQDYFTSLDRTLLKAYQVFSESCTTEDASAALRHLNAGTVALEAGLLSQAQRHFLRAVFWMEEATDEGLERGAVTGRSDIKIYKGDSYERTMVHVYLGLIAYQRSDFADAKREFLRALQAHNTRPAQETRGKFALIHYWLGKSYIRLGDSDNARVAMHHARLSKLPASDEALFDLADIQNNNLTILVQIGASAGLIPTGSDWQRTKYVQTPYPERACDLFIDGKHVGGAVLVGDLWKQVTTQGKTKEQEVQESKAATKAIIQSLPYINTFGVLWDITGDMRSWALLPDRILIWTGVVPPGDHTLTVRFYDSDDYELTRFRQTWYFVPTSAEKETLLILRSARNKCDMGLKAASPTSQPSSNAQGESK